MEQDAFMAGVRPGSPGTQTEIKMLLCFILSKLASPMTFEQLLDALSEDSLVNYFELVGALDSLEQSGHILRSPQEHGEDLFSLSPVGTQAGGEFERALPLSVRERALAASAKAVEREKRLSELSVQVEETPDGGYNLYLSIPENSGALVQMSVYAPNKEQCELIRRRFLNAPGYIYKGMLALLTGDRDVLDEVFPDPQDQLF